LDRFQAHDQQMSLPLRHSFFALTESCPNPIPLKMIYEQIREIGVAHVILSSDLGQTSNPSPVEGFAFYLEKIGELVFSHEGLGIVIHDNPPRLVVGRETSPIP